MSPVVTVFVICIAVLLFFALIGRKRGSAQGSGKPSARLVSAEMAAKRALCLGAVVSRANIFEGGIDAVRDQSAEMQRMMHETLSKKFGAINEYLKSQALWVALSSNEQLLMSKSLGEWTKQEITNSAWRGEALGVIEWALGLHDTLQPYDQQFDSAKVVGELGLSKPASEFLNRSAIRSIDEISKARDIAELWLWRARTTRLQKDGIKPPPNMTFEQIIAFTAKHASAEGFFISIQEDFPAFNKPYSQLSDDEWSMMQSIATERLYALNWLCGYSANWDTVPTGT